MLPSTGCFRSLTCPYHENTCKRPYCHFKHRKRTHDTAEHKSTEEAVPTYNPTPKSQLQGTRSHIPISYVPDLVSKSDRTSSRISSFGSNSAPPPPIYNPTPLSILSTSSKLTSSGSEASTAPKENEKNEDHYNPASKMEETEINYIPTAKKAQTNEENGEQHESDKKGKRTSSSRSKSSKSKEVKSSSKSKSKSSSKKDSKHSSSSSRHRRDSDKDKRSSRREKSSKSSRHSSRRKHSSSEKSKSKVKIKKESDDSDDSSERDHVPIKVKEEVCSSDSDGLVTIKKEPLEKNVKVKEELSSDGENCNEYVTDDESDLEDNPLMECYKIFNEYKPSEPEIGTEPTQEVVREDNNAIISTGKKRIAHDNADKYIPTKKTLLGKNKSVLSPAQVMNNRFKLAATAKSNNEQKNLADEMKKNLLDISSKIKKPTEKPESSKKPPIILNSQFKPSTSLIDDIICGKSSTASKPKRIAPVQNVNSLQQAKAKITQMCKNNVNSKTPVQTVGKNNKRTAHVPECSIAETPDLLGCERSKLPVNVRMKFLTMLTQECVKLYVAKEDAFERAQNEEYKCYERCQVLVTYKNSAMLAISRVRKETHVRNSSELGPLMPGESIGTTVDGVSPIKGAKLYENIKPWVLTEEELDLHGYPREGSTFGKAVIKKARDVPSSCLEKYERKCARCSKIYKVDRVGLALYPEECIYHPLKKRTFRRESSYLCCKSPDSDGCVTSNTHVNDGVEPSDGELEGYQMTMPSEREDDPRNLAIYALDCEMCYTTKGLELTRVTIVNPDCKTVYETLVKPLNPIVDYNTKFSGITKEQMEKTATSILQVQANILHLCSSKTILIGHSLESDMKALKIIHNRIIDTSVLFPHKFGLPHKRALRALASDYLKKIIQNDVGGHDSAEDALTCMELVIWKLKEDLKVRGIKC